MVITFLHWFEAKADRKLPLDPELLQMVALALNIPNSQKTDSLGNFTRTLKRTKIQFEAFINNVVDGGGPGLSLQGAPLDLLFNGLLEMQDFQGKNFFFLVDEYENFEAYQQRIINTLIKHSGESYSFKIGVRELGIKERTTLNRDEQLVSPADYVNINITDKLSDMSFEKFARQVCNERIARIYTESPILRDVEALLPSLSEDAEAELLGLPEAVRLIELQSRGQLSPTARKIFDGLTPFQKYFLKFWADSQASTLADGIHEYEKDDAKWRDRFQNYKHALLFTIRRRKAGIHKYYAGWNVFIKLSGNNIRYLLELVEQSLVVSDDTDMSKPVSFEHQTRAAQRIGKKNLGELEGLSVSGAQLKKMLLSLGRVFQVMAYDAERHAPEVNQFHLSDSNLTKEVGDLLKAAVMHLALLRFPGNKLSDEADTREHDYMIHPIFSAFFEFSYRRKRKMIISGNQLLGLVREPRHAVREILSQAGRTEDDEVPFPEQLKLFENYYHGGDL
jgi:hypothetical protein